MENGKLFADLGLPTLVSYIAPGNARSQALARRQHIADLRDIVAGAAPHLAPGGWLYIGHSERVTGPALDQLSTMGPTIYRKRAA